MCRLFSEDPTTTQSDEFFGIFDYFISSFEEARADNENVKKKKEEEEKIAKQHQEVNVLTQSISCSLTEYFILIIFQRKNTVSYNMFCDKDRSGVYVYCG